MDGETLYNSVAPLRNVASFTALVHRVQNRAHGLPGMATFYGYSGFGKTSAAIYATNKFQAVNVQVKSTWKARKLCEAILDELGQRPARTIPNMVDQISTALGAQDIPLIVDEADFLVSHKLIEIVRDIHEGSGAPVILIGEELLPQKLRPWERVSGRMLDWVAAEPGCIQDVGHLAKIYAPGIEIAPDLQAAILKASNGSIRRICVNLNGASEHAAVKGLRRVTLSDWQGKAFFTGAVPEPRRYGEASRRGAA